MVTFFRNLFSDESCVWTNEEALDKIHFGEWKDLIRAGQQSPDYDNFKKKLPIILWGGEFTARSKAGFIRPSGLMVIDFDNVDRPIGLKNTLKDIPFTWSCFVSPSGKGIKQLVKIPKVASDLEYKEYFEGYCEYFQKKFPHFEIDKSGSDICRACFVSHDSQLFFNGAANVFTLKIVSKVPGSSQNSGPASSKIIKEGSRNDTLTRLVGSWHGQGLSYEVILRNAADYNTAHLSPPLLDKEILTIVNSVTNYNRIDRQTTERDLFTEIDNDYNDESIATDTQAIARAKFDKFIREIAKRESDFDRDRLIEYFSKKSTIKKSTIKSEIRALRTDSKQDNRKSQKKDDNQNIAAVVDELSKLIIIPCRGKEFDNVMIQNTLFIKKSENEFENDTLVTLWDNIRKDNHSLSNSFKRKIIIELKKQPNIDVETLEVEGYNNALVKQICSRIETGVDSLVVGNICQVQSAYFYDRQTKKFFTSSNFEDKIIIRRGYQIIYNDIEIKRNDEAFEDFKKLCGEDHWRIISAFIVAAITNIDARNKNILAIVGSAGSGKSTLARVIMNIIDGTVQTMSASVIEKSAPKLLRNRSYLIDNYNNQKLLKEEMISLICQGLTEETTVVSARYTPEGNEGPFPYLLFTSTNIEIFSGYADLNDRSIVIIHNADLDIREWVTKNQDRIAKEVTSHFYWLAHSFIDWWRAKGCLIERVPGDLRFSNFAFAYYWFLTEICKIDERQALLACKDISGLQSNLDDDFIDLLMSTLDAAMDDGHTLNLLTARQIFELMNQYSYIKLEEVKWLKDSKNKSLIISRSIGKRLVANQIGYYKCIQWKDRTRTTLFRFQIIEGTQTRKKNTNTHINEEDNYELFGNNPEMLC